MPYLEEVDVALDAPRDGDEDACGRKDCKGVDESSDKRKWTLRTKTATKTNH